MKLVVTAFCVILTASTAAAESVSIGDRCQLSRKVPVNSGRARLERGVIVEVVAAARQRVTVRTENGAQASVNRKRLEMACELVTEPAATEPALESALEPTATPPPPAPPAPPPLAPELEPEPPVAPPPPSARAEIAPSTPAPAASPPGTTPLAPAPVAGVSEEVIATAVVAGAEPAVVPSTDEPTTSARGEAETLLATPLEQDHVLAVVIRGTSATDNLGVMAGVRGAWVANRRIGLGAAFFITALGPEFEDAGYRNDRDLFFFYGGPELSFNLFSHRLGHTTLRSLFAAGGAGHYSGQENDVYVGTDLFWAVEPGVEVVANLHDAVRVGVGVGYRFAQGVDLSRGAFAAPGGVLNGVNADVAIYLGRY